VPEEFLANVISHVFVRSLFRVLSVTLATISAHNAVEVFIPVPPMPISHVAVASYIQKY
jgi:hypothetical protein